MIRQPRPCHACRQRLCPGGFTLIEMVAALAIFAVLAAVSIAPLKLERQRAKERELRVALAQIREALDRYKRMTEDGLIEKGGPGASGYPPSLQVLEEGVREVSKPGSSRIYVLRRVPRDPMYPDAATPASRTWGLRSYASPPDSPQAGADVFDVYSLAEGTGLNGIRYRQW